VQMTFASSSKVTAENGSSFLAILVGVGVVGAIPFFLLLTLLLGKAFRTLAWMHESGSPYHVAVPLAIVILAAMLHAGFEDWMFAPGNYICVFFWSLAFILVDVAPNKSRMASRSANVPAEFNGHAILQGLPASTTTQRG